MNWGSGGVIKTASSRQRLVDEVLGINYGVKKEVVLFAHGNRIEIWDKKAYDNLLTDEPDEFAALAEEVMGGSGNQEEDGIS